MKGLVFKSLAEVLEESVPGDVAQIGVTGGISMPEYAPGPNFDSDMVMLKGIIAGALMARGAKEIAFISTDDLTPDQMNYNWDEEAHLEMERRNAAGELDEEYGDLDYPDLLARIYYGHDKERMVASSRVQFERDHGDGSRYGSGFSVEVHEGIMAMNQQTPDNLMAEGTFWVDLVIVHMEGEGGPPSDYYFIKNAPERV